MKTSIRPHLDTEIVRAKTQILRETGNFGQEKDAKNTCAEYFSFHYMIIGKTGLAAFSFNCV